MHLARFRDHFHAVHGHDRLYAVVQREVIAWRTHLTTARDAGGLGAKVGDLPLPPLEPAPSPPGRSAR